eukprot:TRINITY_DN1789_c0_g1_i1.p1 TRINITY_DN1789_c0_g1~~TRINITY_DN1789_c0_g1_i1.p1  ORF type:complete len:488 (+),score=20.17 TRINITY_DN1789_c0_g1_i1:179-1642(+)
MINKGDQSPINGDCTSLYERVIMIQKYEEKSVYLTSNYSHHHSGHFTLSRSQEVAGAAPTKLYEQCMCVIVRNTQTAIFQSALYKEGIISITGLLAKEIIRRLVRSRHLTTDLLRPFLRSSSLTDLDLSRCNQVDLREVAKLCFNIQHLTLTSCRLVNDNIVNLLTKTCTNIRSLNLSYNKKLTDFGILKICQNSLLLQELNMSWSSISDRGLLYIAKHCSNLIRLNISSCKSITGEGVARCLEKSCFNLQSLDLKGCVIDGRTTIKSSTLVQLNLSNNIFLTDTAVTKIDCPSLVHLLLSSCSSITDAAISHILAHCTKLVLLDVKHTNVEEPSFIQTDTLKVIYFNGCNRLKASCVEHIAKNCKNLEEIHLSQTQVSDTSVFYLTNLSALKTLNLGRTDISDVGVAAISSKSHQLQYLDISWCTKITTLSLKNLDMGCPNLKVLKIFGCNQITHEVINEFRLTHPVLELGAAASPLDWAKYDKIP